ncbi:MAG: DUF4382 domain-containing protein [Gammaproteobacteria bacterium]|nr:DUF4382 domain-containing protein [Gammaproteobacteria bacterium]
MKSLYIIFCLLSSLSLLACTGTTSSDNFTGGRSAAADADLTLSITDAASDNATEIWVQFTAVEIKPSGGPSIEHIFDAPMNIDLLSLQGSLSQDFFNNVDVPSGSYNWVRLVVKAEAGVRDTYIVMSDGSEHELSIPSGSQSGLQINNAFELDANTSTAMTIDFDLRRSVVEANGAYHLKPVLRMVNNSQSASISGTIDTALTLGADCSDANPDSGNAVYIYTGSDAQLDDISHQSAPFTTALIDTNTGNYEVGFLPPGDYTVAFTCMADLDDPEANDVIVFQQVSNVSVVLPAATGEASSNR